MAQLEGRLGQVDGRTSVRQTGGMEAETGAIQRAAQTPEGGAGRSSLLLNEVFSAWFVSGTDDEIAAKVASKVSMIEVTGVASVALVIYRGLQAGLLNSRLSKSLGYSPGRITQLGRYGAYVFKLHMRNGYPLDSIQKEKQIREYLEDASTLSNSLDGLADIASQLIMDQLRYYDDPVTGDIKADVVAHPRRQLEENFTRVKSALGTLRNTCKRLQATSDVVGNWQSWAAKADRDDLESLLKMLNWLPRECFKIAQELEELTDR